MTARGKAGAAASTAAIVLLIVAPAGAAARARVLPARNGASFELGHHLSFFTFGDHATAISSRRGTMTSYDTGARTGRTGVVARFGDLGRINVDFEPSGPPSEQSSGPFCHGGPQLTWEGVFTGTVELRGRFGFRPFRDRSFVKKGELTHTPRLVCHEPRESKPPAPQQGNGVLLWASACDGRGLSVQSERPRAPGDGPQSIEYEVRASARDGRVLVSQEIDVSAPAETFSFDEALTTATVSPPAPLHGAGTFSRAPDGSTTWSGDLSATLLGRRFSLAGPGFGSGLESFPMAPGTGYFVFVSLSCPAGEAVPFDLSRMRPPQPQKSLLRPHLGALLPSGA